MGRAICPGAGRLAELMNPGHAPYPGFSFLSFPFSLIIELCAFGSDSVERFASKIHVISFEGLPVGNDASL
jgi:hypothetical protein